MLRTTILPMMTTREAMIMTTILVSKILVQLLIANENKLIIKTIAVVSVYFDKEIPPVVVHVPDFFVMLDCMLF